jgi:hypothetical protein
LKQGEDTGKKVKQFGKRLVVLICVFGCLVLLLGFTSNEVFEILGSKRLHHSMPPPIINLWSYIKFELSAYLQEKN